MSSQLIFAPILAHVALVFFLYLLLLKRKLKAVKTTEVDLKATALNCKAWPDDSVIKCSNNLDNQFQAPILFYVICAVLYGVQGVNQFTLFLAWTFVFSRYLHCSIHVGRNYVPHRMRVFACGIAVLVVMSAYAAYRLVGYL